MFRQAFQATSPLDLEDDLEKYYDIYEVSRSDIQDAEGDPIPASAEDDAETLKALKLGFQKLHINRKLYLCSLLALDADGSRAEFRTWSAVNDCLQKLALQTARVTSDIDEVLGEEEGPQSQSLQLSSSADRHLLGFLIPLTPKIPLTPRRERMRSQMRKLSSLSQGIRGLQAKMHLLRDESDRILIESTKVTELGSNLLTQYDSIGEDLKGLMSEWEDGRTALAANIGKNEHGLSLSPNMMLAPLSPTSSLGGLTAVGGSPPDALKALDGYPKPPRSRSSTTASSSGEEIFEAVAIPRPKSCLTREERIAKLREDRVRQTITKGKADANTHMLRELETVIKLRPRGRTTGRITSI